MTAGHGEPVRVRDGSARSDDGARPDGGGRPGDSALRCDGARPDDGAIPEGDARSDADARPGGDVDTPARDPHAILARLGAEAASLRADARRADEHRRLAPGVVALLRETGCFRITADPLAGGLGSGVAPLVRLARGLGALHASAAWNCVVSNSHAATAGSFPAPPTNDDGRPDADLAYCGVYGSTDATARVTDGGIALDGTWPNASNAHHAQWATIDAAHETLGRVFLVVPMRELRVRHTWHVVGMRGTGSDTLVARDVFVPEAHLVAVPDLERRGRERILALRVPKPVRTSFGLAAVGLGAARALAEAVAARGEPVRRVSPLLPFPVEGPSGFTAAFVQATSRLDAADLVLLDTARALDELVSAGGAFGGDAAIAARTRLARAVRDAADAVHELSLQCGSATAFEGGALGMHWRDAHVALRHGALSAATGFDIGGPLSIRAHAAHAAPRIHAAHGRLDERPGAAPTEPTTSTGPTAPPEQGAPT